MSDNVNELAQKWIKEQFYLSTRTIKYCSNCCATRIEGAKFCHVCGATLSSDDNIQKIKCERCENEIHINDKFCPYCKCYNISRLEWEISQEEKTEECEVPKDPPQKENINPFKDAGFTHYNDLYAKKSYAEAASECRMREYSKMTREEKERLYKKKAINPAWCLLFIPLGIFIYASIVSLCGHEGFFGPFKVIKEWFEEPIVGGFITVLVTVFVASPMYLFIIFAINHNKKLRHELGSYDIKRDAKDVGVSIALGVAAKKATKNAKDIITKPLEPTEVHF